jgi:hypothetical protein
LIPNMLQPFITPALVWFISAKLFSVSKVENEVKRTPLCRCWSKKPCLMNERRSNERYFWQFFRNCTTARKPVAYICQWGLLWI